MKLTNKLFILFILITNINYAQEWVKTDITEFASIDFPVTSELIETGQETVYNATDEFAFYIVGIRKLTDQQSSPISKDDLPTIYQGVVDGTLRSANAELVSINEISIQEIPAVELEYNAQSNPELPTQRFKRIIYLNQYIISIGFWPLTNQTNIINEKKAKYFNSFSINSNEVAQTSTPVNQNSDIYNTSYKTGLLVGQITFFVILIAFLIGIVLLIRYLIKKNRKKKLPNHTEEQSRAKVTKVICKNCNAENKSDIKYCSTCGYELSKM
jgi:ribosomal protein L40E